ncbi:hypothetical protein [Plebeiibacterium marinum]|uniref:DUF2892 domain-containing protein n=1 Tax=Plebeiibacterium marinum TaxID=2992111 RepID=A0AAE3MDK5_9BACT|nr:hypothetical protein [Plebeiobacterium marinum]MCW3805774.1 hypothetical protein [Plebeiobacterium marinum]
MVIKFLKLIIAGFLLVGSVFLFIEGEISYGILAILISGIFVLFYFKNPRNLLALFFVRKNKFLAADKILSSVKNPAVMIKSQEGYFYFLSGLVATQKHEISKADKLLKMSLKNGLRMKTDQAVAKLNLAGIALNRRNKKLAKIYVMECKKLDTRKMLTAQIKEVEHMMKRI